MENYSELVIAVGIENGQIVPTGEQTRRHLLFHIYIHIFQWHCVNGHINEYFAYCNDLAVVAAQKEMKEKCGRVAKQRHRCLITTKENFEATFQLRPSKLFSHRKFDR